jgi:hypothetical protein
MGKRVTFSRKNVDITKYALHHIDLEQALRLYFSTSSPQYLARFTGQAPAAVGEEMQRRLDELDFSSALTVLGATEAVFRIDYLQRCYLKLRDNLSREFRAIHNQRGSRASLDEDIFQAWETHSPADVSVISALRGAFNFRHWLAHGRYWEPKLGRKYDYITVYGLAEAAFAKLPLIV